MQLELDLGPMPTIQKLFFMTTGLFTNELCYTTGTTYGNASGYSQDQAINKLIKYGYTRQSAKSLLLPAVRKTFSSNPAAQDDVFAFSAQIARATVT